MFKIICTKLSKLVKNLMYGPVKPAIENFDLQEASIYNGDLPDVQATRPDVDDIHLNRVGIENVCIPIKISQKGTKELQHVQATFNMFCGVLKDIKGANLSRFVEELTENWLDKKMSSTSFRQLLESLRDRLKADDIYVSASFRYFMPKLSPVTKKSCVMPYDCRFIGLLKEDDYKFILEVHAPITTVCPCSKAMSTVDKKRDLGKGAHNQRGIVTIQTRADEIVWIEDLIEVAEKGGSCAVYPILKRPDEKYVTEKAYKNPRFVEDVTRMVLDGARKLKGIFWVKVRVRNAESIHPHDATAIAGIEKNASKWETSSRGFY